MSDNRAGARPTRDRQEVVAVLEELSRAWAAGDADAYGALHTGDCSYVAFDGTVMRGADGVADGHRALFAGIMRGSRLVVVDREVRDLDPRTAVVVQRAGIVMRWQGDRTEPSRKRLSTSTTLLVATADGWRVAAFQNTRYHPWAQTLAGRLMTLADRSGAAAR